MEGAARLEIVHAWHVAAAMPDVDDDQLIAANVVVDQERIADRWKHAHTGNIRLPSKSGMRSQPRRHAYLIDNRGGRTRTVL